ncbi:MAG: OmpA/MotB family protein [Planctomycetota bacterium]
MAGKGGGAWKVAYADFVTAMMAFFLVMWITAQGKEVKEAVSGYFNDPFGYPSRASSSGARSGDPFALWAEPATARGSGPGGSGVETQSGRRRGQANEGRKEGFFALHDGDDSMRGTVLLFAEDSAQLTERTQEQLKQLATTLLGKRNKIEVRGHTSARPLPNGSPFADAWQLCYARCVAVMQFLEREGVEPDRLRLSQAGPFEPYTTKADASLQINNSRVEVYVLGSLVDDFIGTRDERAKRFETPFDTPLKGPPVESRPAARSHEDSGHKAHH